MPKDLSIRTILLLGSGPIMIGQACEFDYSGTQALKALKAEGFRVILVNSNPATIMTDPEYSDQVYIEPLTVEFLEKIIAKEKPDALLPTMGGQTALNLTVALAEKGILEKYGVRLLGANLTSIKLAEDRELFKQTMLKLGLDVPRSKLVQSLEEGLKAAEEIGFPIILRPSFTLGGEGGGFANSREEFSKILQKGLFLSPVNAVLIEESLVGWKEFELEVVRDKADNVIIVCSIENLDPMGIHTGDSITVAPIQTLTDQQYQQLRDMSKKIIRAINVETGGSNIQFAIKPNGKDAGRIVVIEMNPRVSRSSALASKATGFPIAKIAARLAVGYTLDELKNEITGTTPASFEPAIDYVVTKIPRFDFSKFSATEPLLGTQMKSVGEVMAIGRNFKESLLKAIFSLENDHNWLRKTEFDDHNLPLSKLEAKLKKPLWNRLWYVFTAFRRDMTVEQVSQLTGIDQWFLSQILEVIEIEQKIFSLPKDPEKWSLQTFKLLKQHGFVDREIARYLTISEDSLLKARIKLGLFPSFSQVDTCAGEFEAKTPYLYSTYSEGLSAEEPLSESVLILGGGPNRIGQGIEFDYCCVHASEAARELGYRSIMVNCNPETVSTDYDVSTRLYFEPLTVEHVSEILRYETTSRSLKGAVVQFGGQTPLKLAGPLTERGMHVLGTSVDSIDVAEDRERFQKLMKDLEQYGLKQPPSKTATSAKEAKEYAKSVGYPILLRPSYVLGGRGMRVIFSEESLDKFIDEAIIVSEQKPVLLDSFLSDAVEVDVDAVSDGEQVLIGGIMEHIEEAGVHSGDSACSIPCFTLGQEVIVRLREYTRMLARALKVVGLVNIQYAVQGEDIYVLEVNPRASRTIPFVSKAVGVPLAKIATKVMLGRQLSDLGYQKDFDIGLATYNVKMPVFPFHKFPGEDVLLGPEMKSTGEAMGRASDFASAYAKALIAGGVYLPLNGRAFLSIADSDKPALLEIANKLVNQGFVLDATPGTYEFLKKHGIQSDIVLKVGQGTPDCVAQIMNNRYQLIINTTFGEKAVQDSYAIRRMALEKKIPYCTLMTMARAYLRAISILQNQAMGLAPLKETNG